MQLQVILFLVMGEYVLPVHGETYGEFLATTLPDLCPYNSFCTVGPAKQFSKKKKKVPCCEACSCEEDCLIFGTCCPDFPALLSSATPVQPIAQCTVPVHYGDLEFQGIHTYTERSYVTHTCPKDYNNRAVIDKCIQQDKLDLLDRVAVSDTTGRVFFNRFCAKCNGVKIFTEWKLKLSCEDYSSQLSNISNLKALEDHNCIVVSTPPSAEISSLARCVISPYGTCNTTGLWTKYDPFILRACESSQFQYFKETTHNYKAYRNAFCYKCNENRGMVNECSLAQDDAWRGSLGFRFSAVLTSAEMTQQPASDERDRKCQSTDIYDYNFGKCRMLHCPITMAPHDGKCVQFLDDPSLAVSAQIHVEGEDQATTNLFKNINEDYMTHKANLEKVATAILADAGLNACSKCSSINLLMQKDRGSIFDLIIKTRNKCSIERLLGGLKKFTMKIKHTHLSVGNTNLKYTARMSYTLGGIDRVVGSTDLFSTVTSLFDSSPYCRAHVVLGPLFYCPYIELTADDIAQLLTTDTNRFLRNEFVSLKNGESVLETKKAEYGICVDKYLVAVTSGSDRTSFKYLKYTITELALLLMLY